MEEAGHATTIPTAGPHTLCPSPYIPANRTNIQSERKNSMPGGARLAKPFGGRTLAGMGSPRRIAAPAFAPSDQALKAAHNAGIERSEEKPVYSGGSVFMRKPCPNFPTVG